MNTIWSFDLGKASMGEAVRDAKTNQFLHVASLLIPAEFASTKDAANRRRMYRTRLAHKAREAWLEEVWRAAGLTPLIGRRVEQRDGKWRAVEETPEQKHSRSLLEREFPEKRDDVCYNSALLRIKLLDPRTLKEGETLADWQIYKALRSAIQKRGYGRVPWAARNAKRGEKNEEEIVAGLLKKDPAKLSEEERVYRAGVEAWPKFKEQMPDKAFLFPCYYDAWAMKLWLPEKPTALLPRIDCTAGSTRRVRFDRVDVESEIAALANRAAQLLPALGGAFARWQREGCLVEWQGHPRRPVIQFGRNPSKAAKAFEVTAEDFGAFLVHGPAGELSPGAREDFAGYLAFRAQHGIHPGSADDWLGATGQKTPRFDNRIINDCALISRLQVCGVKVRFDRATGAPAPDSLLASEVTFLMKLKNTLVEEPGKQRKLTPEEVRQIFAVVSAEAVAVAPGEKNAEQKVAARFALTRTDWARIKGIKELALKPLKGHEEIKAPKAEGRSRFSRPALRLARALILSGQKPSAFLARLRAREAALLTIIGMDVLDAEPARFTGNNGREKKFTKQARPWVLVSDLKFLDDLSRRTKKDGGDSWEDLHFPEQRLDALEARHTGDDERINVSAAVRELLGSINDPVVRHRLGIFAKRLTEHQARFGAPAEVVLEFVREDFMGDDAKRDLAKFQSQREKDRKEAAECAVKLGVTERSGRLKYELFKAQSGECLYCQQPMNETELGSYRIEHIVPRAQGGADAMVNYVLAHEKCNDAKGKQTPFQWKHGREGWDAYETCVNRHATALRNKKVQLLLREDAPELVQRYTALAETALISRLAQKIVSLHFGWRNGNDREGVKRVTVVSGGLTARIRRKYRLNSLLAPLPAEFVSDALGKAAGQKGSALTSIEATATARDATHEWESIAEKNRADDRHHALDAMVINFLPQWAPNAEKERFFRFPPTVHANAPAFFDRYLTSVKPGRIVRERPAMEDTIYGRRELLGAAYIVKRRPLLDLATKVEKNQLTIKPMKDIKPQKIVDGAIRRQVQAFLGSHPDLTLEQWASWSASVRLGGSGPRIVKVLMTETDADAVEEYGNFGKTGGSGRGQFRRAESHTGYFILTRPAPTKKNPDLRRVGIHPVFAFESEKEVGAKLRAEPGVQLVDFFWSNCQVKIASEWEFKAEFYPADEYTLKTLWTQGNAVLKHGGRGLIGAKPKHNAPIPIRTLVEAGIQRVRNG